MAMEGLDPEEKVSFVYNELRMRVSRLMLLCTKTEALNVSGNETIGLTLSRSPKQVESRTLESLLREGGVLLDFGCGDGVLGHEIASRSKMTLVQADTVDRRDPSTCKTPLLLVPFDSPPDFGALHAEKRLLPDDMSNNQISFDGLVTGFFDIILLVNTLDKIPYNKIDLLRSLAPILAKGGKIVVAQDSHQSTKAAKSEEFVKMIEEVKTDPIIGRDVVFLE